MISALARFAGLAACAATMGVTAASACSGEADAGSPKRTCANERLDGGFAWRVEDQVAPAQPARRPPQLNTLRDVGIALEICWEANEPPLDQARPGMTVTVMLAFTKTGALLGEPRFTYITREASAGTKALYQRAVVAAINACTPLPISEGLGNALAGSPKTMRFVDQRNQKGT